MDAAAILKSIWDVIKGTNPLGILGSAVAGAIVGVVLIQVFMKNSAAQIAFLNQEVLALKAKFTSFEERLIEILSLVEISKWLGEHMPVLKRVVEVITDDIRDIYREINTELSICQEKFIRNYIDSDHQYSMEEKQKHAINTVDYANALILKELSSFTIEKGYYNIILSFLDLMNDFLAELVPHLESNDGDYQFQATIANKYFENLKKLLTWVEVKQLELKDLGAEEQKEFMTKYYRGIDVNSKLARKDDEDRERALIALAGYDFAERLRKQEEKNPKSGRTC